MVDRMGGVDMGLIVAVVMAMSGAVEDEFVGRLVVLKEGIGIGIGRGSQEWQEGPALWEVTGEKENMLCLQAEAVTGWLDRSSVVPVEEAQKF
jgi:hypothetical protein